MGGKSRDRIYGDKVRFARTRLNNARERVAAAKREAEAAACEVWSAQMEGFGGPARPSPTIAQAIRSGYKFLELKCRRCHHRGSVDLGQLRRHADTELWRLEDSFSCDRCRANKLWRAKAYMVKLAKAPETHVPWYAPEEEDGH